MEHQTRFDLSAAIENWRTELATQPNLTAEVRRELETHLRDAITGFHQRGLNEEESFWLACRRIGQPQPLGEEFVKANPAAVWRERVFWMAIASLAVNSWTTVFYTFYTLFVYHREFFSPSSVTWFEWIASIFGRNIFIVCPVLVAAIWLARNKAQSFNLPTVISNQPKRVIIVALIFFVLSIRAANFLSNDFRIGGINHSQLLVAPFNFIFQIANESFWPLMLVGLIAWLLPSKNKKATKPA